ncbi:protein kinase [Pleurocapsa sp. PCC 7319]|uniref:protein kinase domain-containing protein n=1 Tax=Pleurocapsa sp. PCC 7319 TaxID=118161 RepID=UPI00035F94E4|nr:protein kinase [Pleurocapsa sp. PCC 7319]
MELPLGKILDRRYRMIEVLGEGGFGKTFLAQDTKRPGNPICVVKQLKTNFSTPEVFAKAQELFNREAEILENLGKHPNIPTLLAYFAENERFYLVQEYISGHTLNTELISEQPLPEAKVTEIMQLLLLILQFVHSKNVIHRDIKPENIILREEDNQLILIDFGAVKKVTATPQQQTIIGTPQYIPEEQLRGQPTFSSDLYAVGIIALQALTGITPDYDRNWQEILSQDNSKLSDSAPRSGLSSNGGKANRLRDFLLKMSAQDACQRYQSATEALQVLNNILNTKAEANVISPAKTSNIILRASALISGLFAVATIYLLFNKSNLEQQSLSQLKLDNKSKESLLDENDMCDNFMEQVYCEEYFFSGERGQTITIEMNSQQFDSYLVIRQPDGNKLAINNDISPQDWNSRITVNLPRSGQYKAIARTSAVGESGKYTIRAKIK